MELWPEWVRIAGVALVGFALLFAPYSPRLWMGYRAFLQTILRVAGVLLLLFASFIAWDATDAAELAAISPDHVYSARVLYGGFFWPLETLVVLHKTGTLRGEQTVYAGDGWEPGGGEGSPQIEWQDDAHLLIRIHGPQADMRFCRHPPGPVVIVCVTNNW